MGTNTEGLLHKLSTVAACLCGIAGVHSNDLMTSSCSLIFKDSEKRSPTGVENALRQMMVLDHIHDLKVLDSNMLIAKSIRLGDFEMMVTTLAIDLEMRLSDDARRLAETLTALFTSRELALFAPECRGARAIETGISHGMAFAISQEGLETHINADIRMRTFRRSMVALLFCLTDDEGVPVSIGSQNEVNSFRLPVKWSVQFDLERLAKFGRHDKVFLVFMQIGIFAILPQLDGVPPVRFLEAREAALLTQCFHGKKAFQGFGEPVSEHLQGGGWHLFFALSLELCFQFILVGEGTTLIIFLLGNGSHLIIDTTRFRQTGDELTVLDLIWVQAVLECSHERILQY